MKLNAINIIIKTAFKKIQKANAIMSPVLIYNTVDLTTDLRVKRLIKKRIKGRKIRIFGINLLPKHLTEFKIFQKSSRILILAFPK